MDYRKIKDCVTARQAAEFYGIKVNSHGMCVCPFHNDKNPSMKVDKFFHCFGCGEHGSVIDFVAKLFNLSIYDAARKLSEDFHIDSTGAYIPAVRVESEREKVQRYYAVLCQYARCLAEWKREYAPKNPDEAFNPLFAEAMKYEAFVDYLMDILATGTSEEQREVLKNEESTIASLEKRLSA